MANKLKNSTVSQQMLNAITNGTYGTTEDVFRDPNDSPQGYIQIFNPMIEFRANNHLKDYIYNNLGLDYDGDVSPINPPTVTPQYNDRIFLRKVLDMKLAKKVLQKPATTISSKVQRTIESSANRYLSNVLQKLINKFGIPITISAYNNKNNSIYVDVMGKGPDKYNYMKHGAFNLNFVLYYLYKLDKDKLQKILKFPLNIINDEIANDVYEMNEVFSKITNNMGGSTSIFNDDSFYIKKLDKDTYLLVYSTRDSDSEIYDFLSDREITICDSLQLYFFGKKSHSYYKRFANYLIKLENKIYEKKFEFKENTGKYNHNIAYTKFNSNGQLIDESDRNIKTLEDIILKDNIKKELIDSIDHHFDNVELFTKYSIPQKLGIMLYGEPGTGKSTIAKAICDYIGESNKGEVVITYIDLSTPNFTQLAKESINRTISDRRRPASTNCIPIFIIEDIDIIMIKNRNEGDINDKARMQELMSLLDGQGCPNNTIFIATTNKYISEINNDKIEDVFDEALTRDGRFDIKMYIGNFDRDLAIKMAEYFDIELSELENEFEINYPIKPATLQNLCCKYIMQKSKQNVVIGSEEKEGL